MANAPSHKRIHGAVRTRSASARTSATAAPEPLLVLASGTAGKRYALPHARILIHQPYSEGGGQGSDIEIQANEILRMRTEMEGIIAEHTGRPVEEIGRDIERDKILTAEMAKEYGIVDQVIESRKVTRK